MLEEMCSELFQWGRGVAWSKRALMPQRKKSDGQFDFILHCPQEILCIRQIPEKNGKILCTRIVQSNKLTLRSILVNSFIQNFQPELI